MTAPPRRWDWREHCANPACKWVRLYRLVRDGWCEVGIFRSAYWAGEYQRTHQEQP